MAPPSKATKGPRKSTSPEKGSKDKPKPSKAKPKDADVISIPPAEAEDNSDEEADADSSEDSDDDGVDEVGMERLMKALGDDGLDEFEQMQLHLTLGGENEAENGDDEDTSDEEFILDKNAGEGSGVESSDSEEGDDEEEFEDDEGEDVEEGEADVALDDVESVDEDAVPRQKIEIDNTVALARIRETIQLDPSLPWTETLVLTYPDAIEVAADDDLNRELAFYKQALHGANAARALAAQHNFPFTRPTDYFAEMVKSDAHMERIRQRLLDESAGIKKSDDKRKEREGKKFGKQVQIERLKEREKGKKEMEERLKGLKRKRGDMLDKPNVDEDFDIAVEDAIADRPAKRGRGVGGSKISRQSRDQKFGFGGAGKRSKSNTRESTDDFGGGSGGKRGGFGGRGGRGGARGGSSRGFGRDGARGGGRGGASGGRGGFSGGRGGATGG
ncbi:eukaryotic rRNA processing protein EBP2-domain-containing protein, partial [Mycena haematopus]